MTYYLYLPGDDLTSELSPNNILGESSFKSFYPEVGFKALNNIITKHPDIVEHLKIVDAKNIHYTIEEFLDIISKLNIQFVDA
jgi:hypothetical protein